MYFQSCISKLVHHCPFNTVSYKCVGDPDTDTDSSCDRFMMRINLLPVFKTHIFKKFKKSFVILLTKISAKRNSFSLVA